MSTRNSIYTILLTLVLAVSLTGCAKISLGGDKGGGGKTDPANPGGQPDPGATANSASLNGYWTIAFQFKDDVGKSNVQLQQQGNQISGSGTDEGSNKSFNVSGTIDGQTVQFVKQYESAGAAVPPVQYDGKLEMVNDKEYQGPYMSGQYTTTINGQQVSNSWEAQLSQSGGTPGGIGTATPDEAPAPAPAPHPDKAPDLSGKWKVAYKSNFKTISSTMFLEQDKDHLTGRGVDTNTNEKFDVEKGWYAFPKVTIVRVYKKGKNAASDRTVQFKGTVEWVTEKDYQGPYMRGETQGGGDWEAQLVR